MWVPEAVFPRMTFSLDRHEARADLYTAAINHFSEYVLVGVGNGNFYGSWGMSSEFYLRGHHVVVPAHNSFVQVTLYWGLVGFLALLMVIWQAYRCVPKRCGMDSLSLCLLGIAIGGFLSLFSLPDLYNKSVSVLLGTVVGARYWIWPDGIVPSGTRASSPHSKIITNTQIGE
jgi:O-antigen ligase